MSTEELIVKLLITIFMLGSAIYVTAYCTHKVFMPRDEFEKFLMNQSKFVRKFATWHKPNVTLNRVVYIIGVLIGLAVLLILGIAAAAFWT